MSDAATAPSLPRLFHNPARNPAAAYPAALEPVLDAASFAAARREIASWPDYGATPLVALPNLARALGLGRLWYKDESRRFGLKSFKALGGAYAVFRLLKREIERRRLGREVTSRGIMAGDFAEFCRTVTVTCATDGNHGRSVAWGAQLFGCRCVIYVHAAVSEGRRAAIARYGAEVRRVPGNYDDAVRHAADEARRSGWFVVSDTSYEGYTDVPRDVMHGYGVMADEAVDQLAGQPLPTHVFVQAGVGALAAAVAARLWQRWGEHRPRLVVVEPEKADCLYQSAVAGRPTVVHGDLDTVMAGLACGEVSLLAWEALKAGADDFMAIPDAFALDAVRLLANPKPGDAPVVAGETGAAGLAAVLAAVSVPAQRAALGLGPDSRILLFGSEGDTDPEIYRRIVGRSAAEVLAG